MSVAPYFRLTEKEATGIIGHIKSVVSQWRETAEKYQIPKLEINKMNTAFKW